MRKDACAKCGAKGCIIIIVTVDAEEIKKPLCSACAEEWEYLQAIKGDEWFGEWLGQPLRLDQLLMAWSVLRGANIGVILARITSAVQDSRGEIKVTLPHITIGKG